MLNFLRCILICYPIVNNTYRVFRTAWQLPPLAPELQGSARIMTQALSPNRAQRASVDTAEPHNPAR